MIVREPNDLLNICIDTETPEERNEILTFFEERDISWVSGAKPTEYSKYRGQYLLLSKKPEYMPAEKQDGSAYLFQTNRPGGSDEIAVKYSDIQFAIPEKREADSSLLLNLYGG